MTRGDVVLRGQSHLGGVGGGQLSFLSPQMALTTLAQHAEGLAGSSQRHPSPCGFPPLGFLSLGGGKDGGCPEGGNLRGRGRHSCRLFLLTRVGLDKKTGYLERTRIIDFRMAKEGIIKGYLLAAKPARQARFMPDTAQGMTKVGELSERTRRATFGRPCARA